MNTAYRRVIVAVPPPASDWYQQPADVIRKAAAALSMIPGVELKFIGVFSITEEMGTGEVNLMPAEALADKIREAEAKHRADVESYVKWFADNKIPHSLHIEEGNPAELILRHAEEWKADLILLGAHHKHSFLDFFTSDVTSKVTKRAPCDVMLMAPAGKAK